MKLPALDVFLHHSVTTVTNFPYKDTKLIENIGIQRFGQMSYSYLVHPNGTILEGAGTKTGAHTAKRNSTSFGLCLIGNYSYTKPTDAQIKSVRWLVYHLKEERNILRDSAVLTPHRSVESTACPGDSAMSVLAQLRAPWVPEVPKVITPMFNPPLVLEPIAAELEHNGGVYLLASSGALYAFGGAPAIRGANGQPYFVNRLAARAYVGDDPALPPHAKGAHEGISIQTVSDEWYGPLMPGV